MTGSGIVSLWILLRFQSPTKTVFQFEWPAGNLCNPWDWIKTAFLTNLVQVIFSITDLSPDHYLLIYSLLLRNAEGEDECISQQFTEDHLWKCCWLLAQQGEVDVWVSNSERQAREGHHFTEKHRDGQNSYTTQKDLWCGSKLDHCCTPDCTMCMVPQRSACPGFSRMFLKRWGIASRTFCLQSRGWLMCIGHRGSLVASPSSMWGIACCSQLSLSAFIPVGQQAEGGSGVRYPKEGVVEEIKNKGNIQFSCSAESKGTEDRTWSAQSFSISLPHDCTGLLRVLTYFLFLVLPGDL